MKINDTVRVIVNDLPHLPYGTTGVVRIVTKGDCVIRLREGDSYVVRATDIEVI